MSIEWTPQAHKVVEARPYTGETLRLDATDLAFFRYKYQICARASERCISVDAASNRYVLPFGGPDGYKLRGHILRMPWDGSPRRVTGDYMKADTFKINPHDPLLAWYTPDVPLRSGQEAVLVEDQLSAIKLLDRGIPAIACLGKPVSTKYSSDGNSRVHELARHSPWLVVALDADATADAFAFVRQWGPAFKSIRVAILQQDIKDTPIEDIRGVLGI